MDHTIASIDAELLRTHERFLRADSRNDVGEAADLWNRLEALLDERTLIPQQ